MQKALQQTKQKINTHLEQTINAEIKRKKDSHPFILQTLNTLKDYTLRSGKRIRPILTYYTYKMLTPATNFNEQEILKACTAIELIGTYLLVEDDIIDQAESRRNKPSAHKEYEEYYKEKYGDENATHFGQSIALLIGLEMAHLANQTLASINMNSQRVLDATKQINNQLLDCGYGEILDVLFEREPPQTEKELLEMSFLKTATYTAVNPIITGAILANTNKETLDNLNLFASKLGTAFQIQDDILGTFAKTKALGKPADLDLKEGKHTLLILYALEQGTQEEQDFIKNNLGDSNMTQETYKKIKSIMRNTGAYKKTKLKAEELLKEALSHLEKVQATIQEPKSFEILKVIAHLMVTRDK